MKHTFSFSKYICIRITKIFDNWGIKCKWDRRMNKLKKIALKSQYFKEILSVCGILYSTELWVGILLYMHVNKSRRLSI